ncbi:MAG: trehalase family glycosidase [bacterium]|nr:trehalase family glycosidase [bacterium]
MKIPAQDVIDKAKQVIYGNLKTGYSNWAKMEYKYICPSRHHYSHQWFWDSCFHAIVLSHFDPELAKNELRNLTKMQREDGFIPHVIFWDPPLLSLHGAALESKFSLFPKTTELIQPPLLAEAVNAIYQKDKDRYFLVEMLPKLTDYYSWLADNRDPDRDGLLSIIAPYESGMDQSPSYDEVCDIRSKTKLGVAIGCRKVTLRHMLHNYDLKKIFAEDYFNVEDVFVNSIYIKNLKVLVRLLESFGEEKQAKKFSLIAKKAQDNLIAKCFDEKTNFFFDTYSKEEKNTTAKTIKGLMPLILGIDEKIAKNLVTKHLSNKDEFDLPYPVPTVAADDPDFRARPTMIFGEPLIWRGPTWISTNWYLVNGLREHGFGQQAEKIVEASVGLVRQQGFREFFDPISGKGFGAEDFSWSTLVVDMIQN